MKHRAFLRRALPLLTLIALVMTFAVPTYAAVTAGDEATLPTVATFSKNGPATASIGFTAEDFKVENTSAALDSIILTQLPDAGAGMLTLGSELLAVGDIVSMGAVNGLSFQPLVAPTLSTTAFSFTPVFADGISGSEVSVDIHLLAAKNNPPIAENLDLCTYKNVAITCNFAATDPEGDLLTFQLVKKPARGEVTMPTDGSTAFVYTPYENKTGKDSFTYVAVDAVGNTSAPATVKIRIEKASTKVTYADMDGVPSYKAAIRMAEEGIFVGECMNGQHFFDPSAPVSRSEFVAMTMKATGLEPLDGITTTGFFDDETIPTWAKGYAASALKSGVVQGSANDAGQIVFAPESAITRAEASVMLNRALQITDVSAETMLPGGETAPVWAAQSVANLQTCGILKTDASGTLGLSVQLTRADAAELILGAIEVLDSRDSGSLFPW